MAQILLLPYLFIMYSLLISTSVFGELERLKHPNISTGSSKSLNFLVVGDWGRKGFYNQTHVAHQMGIIGEKLDIEFVISVGDNFYDDGLKGVSDPSFVQSFSNIYTAESLQKPWYNVLGNHDYRGNVKAQLSPILNKIDSRWICKRSFILNAEIAEFFFFDTTPFVDKYFTTPKEHTYDWRSILPRNNYMNNLLKDMESALKESNARWKIVVAHHPIRSAGDHGDTVELHTQLLPILEANNIDFYINGHDHCLEHISTNDSPIQYLTSGGGSKAWRGENNESYEGLNFYYDGQGFMSVQLTQFDAEVAFYDIFGEVLHKFNSSSSSSFTQLREKERLKKISSTHLNQMHVPKYVSFLSK